MAVGQRERRELQEAMMNALGADPADTLMGYLPPVGWADVATKHDLDVLTTRVDRLETKVDGIAGRLEGLATKQDLQMQFYWTITLMVMLFSAFAAVIKFA